MTPNGGPPLAGALFWCPLSEIGAVLHPLRLRALPVIRSCTSHPCSSVVNPPPTVSFHLLRPAPPCLKPKIILIFATARRFRFSTLCLPAHCLPLTPAPFLHEKNPLPLVCSHHRL